MKVLNYITWLLVVIGAINWGLVGAFHFNLVQMIFHSMPMVLMLVYVLVGLSGIYMIFRCKSCCKSS